MKKRAILIFLSMLTLGTGAFGQTPQITAFSPSVGATGTSVTITGSNFNPAASGNIVYLGAVQAKVQSATAGSLTVLVPPGATYQPITVTNTGTHLSAISRTSFVVSYSMPSYKASAFSAQDLSRYQVANTSAGMVSTVISEDVDGDGKPDLVYINQDKNPNSISVKLNTAVNGLVSFAAAADITVPFTAQRMCMADIDGDGLKDIVYTDAYDNVEALQNQSTPGNSRFGSPVKIYSTKLVPRAIKVADMDSDGKLDVLVATDDGLYIFKNNNTTGSITAAAFQNAFYDQTLSVKSIPNSENELEVSDLNLDGKPDVIIANYDAGTISVLQNTSTTSAITLAPKINVNCGQQPANITVADVNSDGKPDVLVASANGYADIITALVNSSAVSAPIGAATLVLSNTINAGGIVNGLVLSDIDGDGKVDILVGGAGNLIMYTKLGVSAGSLTYTKIVKYGAFNLANSTSTLFKCVDVNGDGRTDLLSYSFYGSSASTGFELLLNDPQLEQASNLQFKATSTSATLNWQNGSGTGRAVFVNRRIFGYVDNNWLNVRTTFSYPKNVALDTSLLVYSANQITGASLVPYYQLGQVQNAVTYKADAAFKAGDQINPQYFDGGYNMGVTQKGSAWFCGYNGTASKATVTGLKPDSIYRFKVIEYTGAPGSEVYSRAGASVNYIDVHTQANDTLLHQITVSGGLLSNTSLYSLSNISPGSYSTNVDNYISSVAITPVGYKSSIYINGSLVSGRATVALALGKNVFTIKVVAEDTSLSTKYTLNITRNSRTKYYALPQGDITALTTWNSVPDGSGSAPKDFNGDGKKAWYQLTANATLSKDWIVGDTLAMNGYNLEIGKNKLTVQTIADAANLSSQDTSFNLVVTDSVANGLTVKGSQATLNSLNIRGKLLGGIIVSGPSLINNVNINGKVNNLSFNLGTINAFNIGANSKVSLAAPVNLKSSGTCRLGDAATLKTNGYLTLKSDSLNTAQITYVGLNSAITDSVTTERFLSYKAAWRLLCPPVNSSQTINNSWQEGAGGSRQYVAPGYGTLIFGGSAAKGFDGSSTQSTMLMYNSNGTLSGISSTNIAFNTKPAYFLFSIGDRNVNYKDSTAHTSTTLRNFGALRYGTIADSVAAKGFTLLANPYAASVDFSALTKSNVQDQFYVWDFRIGKFGGYVLVSKSGSTYTSVPASPSGLNQIIQSGTALFVQATDSTAKTKGVLTFTEAAKATAIANRPSIFSTGPAANAVAGVDALRINLTTAEANATLLDGVMATYGDNSSGVINAAKLKNFNESISLTRLGASFALERRAPVAKPDTLSLDLERLQKGQYNLQVDASAFKPGDTYVAYLFDNYLKQKVALRTSAVNNIMFATTDNQASFRNRYKVILASTTSPFAFANARGANKVDSISLTWQVSNEDLVKTYTLKKWNGSAWAVLRVLPSTNAGRYTLADSLPQQGANTYQISASGLDGAQLSIIPVEVLVSGKTKYVSVYPNPVAQNMLNMYFVGMPAGTYSATVLDINGQKIQQQSIVHSAGQEVHTTPIVGVRRGIYILQIKTATFNQVQKFIVQ